MKDRHAFNLSPSTPHLSLVPEPEPAPGVLLPVLRQEHWIVASETLRRRLLPLDLAQNTSPSPGPWITLGIDTPDCLDTLLESEPHGSWSELMGEATQNLAARLREVQPIGPQVMCVTDEYAAEAILLLPEVSKQLADRLGCAEMVVAAVGPGSVLVGARADEPAVTVLSDWAQRNYDRRTGRRISRAPIVMSQGKVVGLLDTTTVKPLQQRPWWQYW